MRKYGKRLLSFVLTLAMIVGMVNMPAKAAEVTTTEFTIDKMALDKDYLYPKKNGYWPIWQIYLYTSVELPADTGDYQFELSDGKTKVKARANKSSVGTNLLYLEVPTSMLPEVCEKTFTIKKGEYTSSSGHVFKLQADYKIRYESGVWSPAGVEDMLSAENMVQLLPGYGWGEYETTNATNGGLYLHTATDNGAYTETNGDWNDRMKLTAVVTNEAQTVFYGGAKWYADTSEGKEQNRNSTYITDGAYKLVKFTETSYYLEFPGITVSENDLVRVGGYFKDYQGKTYGFYPITMKYNGSTWEEVKSDLVGGYEGYLTVNSDVYLGTTPVSTALYLKGTDGYASWIGGANNDKWNEYKVDLEKSTGSILVDGQKATSVIFQKYNGKYNAYYLENITDVEKDSVVTIEGSFVINGATVTFEKSQFKWDGTKWIDVPVHSGELLTTQASGAQIDSNRTTGLYMKGSDSYMSDRTYQDWDAQDIKMKAADENSGVFVDGVRMAEAQIWKYDVSKNWYYLNGADITTASKVVIKGNFKTLEGRYAVSIEESTFTWDGSKWVNAVSEITIDKLALDKDYLRPKENAEWPIWQFHFYGNVDVGTTKTYIVSVEIDGAKYDTVLTDSPDPGLDKVLYSKLEKEWLNMKEGSKVTYKAGKCFADDKSGDFITLKNDYTFYVNQYGWSTESLEAVTPSYPTQEKIKLDVTTAGTADGFYITTNIDDGRTPDGDTWQSRIHFNAVVEPYATYYSGGAWKQASGATSKTQRTVTLPLVKLKSNQYYVALSDFSGGGASSGDTYTVGGFFKDEVTGITYGFSTLTVQWDGASWKQISTSLDDTGVKYDVNGDYKSNPTSKDLVALLNYNADTDYPINIAQADIYVDNKYNKEDVIKLRKIIVDLYDADGNYLGAPDYSANRTFEKMAYACPQVGEWDEKHTTFTPYGSWTEDGEFIPNESLATTMQQYKDSGLTLLCMEDVGSYEEAAPFDSEANEPMRVYLKVAEQYDLGILAFDVDLYRRVRDNDFTDTYGTGKTWQENLEQRIAEMKNYSKAFKGFMSWDEIKNDNYEAYAIVANYLKEKHPELIVRMSFLPETSSEFKDNVAYEEYVGKYAVLSNHFSYNSYPLQYSYKQGKVTQSISEKKHTVLDTWFTNLKLVTDLAKTSEYSFDTGITIQAHSSKLTSTSDGLYNIYTQKYEPTDSKDIGFQAYTAMAYGMKEINYFNYRRHEKDSNIASGMVDDNGKPNAVYTAVQTVNKQIDKFASVYQAFTWKDTVKIAANNSGTVTTDNGRLTSASVTGAETVIGHMVDVDGFDGYMIANANAPRKTDGSVATATATVNLTFTNATKALVYNFSAGTKTEVALSNGVTSVTVPVGGGVMVIPVK